MSIVRRVVPLVVIATPLLLSCSSTPVTMELAKNPRVIERTLAVSSALWQSTPDELESKVRLRIAPTVEPVIQTASLNAEPQLPQQRQPPAPDAIFFVEFANESVALEKSLPIESIKTSMESGSHVFVVGQSHGPSAIGTQHLAVERANAVAHALIAAAIDSTRVHTLASWSATKDVLSPPRGVSVFVVQEDSPLWQAFLALPTSGRVAQETH